MDDLDWNESAKWDRAAEHADENAGDDSYVEGEQKHGPLSELIRDYFAKPDARRLAIRIVRANGLPLDNAEIVALSDRPDYPFRKS